MALIIYEYPVKDAIIGDVHLSNTFDTSCFAYQYSFVALS